MGKKDDDNRKLVLRRQSMRTLSAAQLDKVNGGRRLAYTQAGWQCDTTICDPTEANAGGWGGDWGGGWGGDWGGGWDVGGDWGW